VVTTVTGDSERLSEVESAAAPFASPHRSALLGYSRKASASSTRTDSPAYDLGWMWKRGRIVPSWKRRWAVVRAGCLCYFADADELMLKGSLTLKGANCRLVQIAAKDSPRSLGPQLGFQVEVGTQVLLGFPAGKLPATKQEVAPWVLAFNEAIEEANAMAANPEAMALVEQEQADLARHSQVALGVEAEDAEDEEDPFDVTARGAGDGASAAGPAAACDTSQTDGTSVSRLQSAVENKLTVAEGPSAEEQQRQTTSTIDIQ